MRIDSRFSPSGSPRRFTSAAGTWLAGWSLAISVGAALVTCCAAQDAEPATTDLTERIASLVHQLGDDDFFLREQAQAELAGLGFEAYDALAAAEDDDDIEVSSRAQYLLERMKWTVVSDPPEVKLALEGYDTADDAQRRAAIKRLADIPPPVGVAALCRLARFERSELRSKLAALAVVGQQPLNDDEFALRSATIDQAVGSSDRVAARWLRAHALMHDDPPAAADAWRALIEAEVLVLRQDPSPSQTEILLALRTIQVELLSRLGRHDEYTQAMADMIELEIQSGGTEKLAELIVSLTRREAWDLVDEMAARFDERVQDDPLLLYCLAEAHFKRGNEQAANDAAQRAGQLSQGGQVQHLLLALDLRQRSLARWAERELRRAIDVGKPLEGNTLRARFMLAEMLHDRDDNLDAARVLEQAVDAMQTNIDNGDRANNADRPIGAIRSRMLYFHWRHEAETDPESSSKRLLEAIDADPTDADVLIALYHLPNQTPVERQRTLKLIQAATDEFRQQLSRAPEDPTPHNQLAWLVGNTEGDLDEAIQCSQKSLELLPDTSGYYDTLAHCYFARNDYENAVRFQTKAVAGDPSSGLMAKKLKVFQAALEAAAKTEP